MAIFNEILAPRYAKGLQKLFGIKGTVPAKQLAGEVSPAFQLFSGRENRFLEGWSLFGCRFAVGAVAAQNSVIRFSNPLGSNIVCVLESLLIALTAAGEIFIDQTPVAGATTDLSGINTACSLDARSNLPGVGSGGAAGHLSGANNVGAAGFVTWLDTNIPLNLVELITHEDQQISILPGVMIQVRPVTVNVGNTVSIRWRERTLEESERA